MAQTSLVNYSHLRRTYRLDAEFFSLEHLKIERLLLARNTKTLHQLRAPVVSGPFGSTLKSSAYRQTGIPFIRISDLSSFFIAKDSLVYIDESDNERIESSELLVGDLVLSKVGNTIGVVSKVTAEIGTCNISENNIGINLRHLDEITKNYVLVFLNCHYGQMQILRYISGNAQPKLNVSDIANVQVVLTKVGFRKTLSEDVNTAQRLYYESAIHYSQAEQLLLSELGLLNWEPYHTLAYVRNYSQAAQVQRMDAEYFQPVYQVMFDRLNSSVRLDRLGKLTTCTKGVEVGSSAYVDSGIPFWRVSNLTKYGLDDSSLNYISEELYNSLRLDFEPQQGEILLSKDATPGIAYYLESLIRGIASSGILRLKVTNNIPPHYLEIALNLLFVQMQIQQNTSGSVIKHWKPSEVRKTLIPRLSPAREVEIAELVKQSHAARRESKAILEKAKRAVEIAVEEGEDKAMDFLSNDG